jgi:long-chain fatty acid transport protein
MSKFGRYRGLFAEQGDFDIPANVAAGIAFKAFPNVTLLLDGERIFYSQVKSIANNGSNQAQLGTTNGPGFGWHDITAIKTGVQYKLNSAWTLRAGYNHSGVPFDKTQTFFNILAPAVVQDHLTLGATWNFSNGKEINLAYVHAFANTVYGFASISPSFGGGNANLHMYQDSIGISFGWDRNSK